MTWRATSAEIKADNSGAARKKAILGRIDDGVPLGLIGYAEGEPVAWVSIAPKQTFAKIGGPEPEHGAAVWSLSCMFIKRSSRGQGLGHELISAAIAHARKHGAHTVEAYPVAPDSPSYRFMGFVPAFQAAGFKKLGTEGTRRTVMQLTVKPAT